MKSLNWSAIVPPDGPDTVERAREQVRSLRAKVTEQRATIEAAKVALAQAEQADREAMATAIRRGAEPRSQTAKIERLRAALAEAERRDGALDLAIGQTEAALGEAVEKAREQWQREATEHAEQARDRARSILDTFEQAVGELRAQQEIASWLDADGGFDTGRPPRAAHIGYARSSSSVTANHTPIDLAQLVVFVRESIEPVPQPVAVEHHRVSGPEPEAFMPRAMPVEAA